MGRLGLGYGINAGGASLTSVAPPAPPAPSGSISVTEYCVGLTETTVKFDYTSNVPAKLSIILKDTTATPKERLSAYGINLAVASAGTYDHVFQNSALASGTVIQDINRVDAFISPASNPGWVNRMANLQYANSLVFNYSCTSLNVSQFDITSVPSGWGSGAIGTYLPNASRTVWRKDGYHYLSPVNNGNGMRWDLIHTIHPGRHDFTTVFQVDENPTVNVHHYFSVGNIYYA